MTKSNKAVCHNRAHLLHTVCRARSGAHLTYTRATVAVARPKSLCMTKDKNKTEVHMYGSRLVKPACQRFVAMKRAKAV